MTADATDLICRGKAKISTKSGSRGQFKVCEIVFPFITVEVIDSWISDYQDGEYFGDFTIQRIFNHTYVCRRTGGVRISFRAIFTNLVIYEGTPPCEMNLVTNQNHKLENENLNLKRQVENLENQLAVLNAKNEESNFQLRSELEACQSQLVSVQQDLEEEIGKSNGLLDQIETEREKTAKSEKKNEDLISELAESKQALSKKSPTPNSSKLDTHKRKKKVAKSDLFKIAFGNYFGDDIHCVSQLPSKIDLKLIDEDIVADRSRLAAISKLLNNKTGAGYTFDATSLTWEKKHV
ncbi:hypothetical protein N478_03875 [Pseudoalteromonas luteoviolacea S4060-1]|uniref:Uncharacterized protein n=2 Tax=Pseudoalteromonas luteoviolacea TaxID=43657 RepID=A0A162AXR2_9GAMM|nr:hypothetical protein N478_03875 [Pseudoalteromonas luteoviolacea S4060-1]